MPNSSPSSDRPSPNNAAPEAQFYSRQTENDSDLIFCELCPQGCRIAPGKSGRCHLRVHHGGRLTLPYYGRFTSLAIDPIEKKPLYHFYPGSSILSIGTAGCNLTCRFCQNWSISQEILPPERLSTITPEDFAELAKKRGIPSVAFTYNEPSIWAEFVIDAATACRERQIKTVAVTNGMIYGDARRAFYSVLDGVNVDLKAFTNDFYRNLCGGLLESVKETIKYIAQETDCWLEVTNLLIPTKNDSPEEIKKMTDWLIETAGPDVPLHFSAFFPTYRLTDQPRTPIETLRQAAEIAQNAGLRFVYLGNVASDEGQNTYCPQCGREIISRSGYRTISRILPEQTESALISPQENRYSLTPSTLGSFAAGEYSFQFQTPPVPIQPIKSKTNRGHCPNCRAVIPGRFF